MMRAGIDLERQSNCLGIRRQNVKQRAAGSRGADSWGHADRSGNGLRTAQRELSRTLLKSVSGSTCPQLNPLQRKPLLPQAATSSPIVRVVTNVIPSKWAYQTGLRTAHFRDPNGPQATFANEQFVDEIAAALKVDPIEFRLSYFNAAAKRDINVIQQVQKASGWVSTALAQQ